MQWVLFIQISLLLLLVCPGVLSIGTLYALAAQIYIVVAVNLNNPAMIKNAAQVNTGVAAGNILLQLLVWYKAVGMLSSSAAAFRAAIFAVAGVIMIVTSEFLLRHTKRLQKS